MKSRQSEAARRRTRRARIRRYIAEEVQSHVDLVMAGQRRFGTVREIIAGALARALIRDGRARWVGVDMGSPEGDQSVEAKIRLRADHSVEIVSMRVLDKEPAL
jgi:hypothetical protein